MFYVGLDVHSKTTSICVLTESGQVHKEYTIKGTVRHLLEELPKLPRPFSVCFEVSTGYGFLYDHLSKIAQKVLVADGKRLAWIYRSKRKNDRVDARKLAHLLRVDLLPTVYIPSPAIRSWRGLIEYRQRLVAERVRVKNRIRALLRHHGIDAPRSLWTWAGRQWLQDVKLPSESEELQRELALIQLGQLDESIKRIEKVLDRIGRHHGGVQVLLTIPGVGMRTAEAVMAYVADPHRFSFKQIGSYFGLVPAQDASAEKNRLGHITRQGPVTVRKLIAEATWQAIRRSPKMKAFFEQVRGNDPDRKKIAIVATMHYLLRIMLSMLKTAEVWRESAA